MNLLYLVHRLPFPPNKGDKVRSYHLLRHLAGAHRIYLGTFVDDPEDQQHVPTVQTWCEDACFINLNPRVSTLRSSVGLLTGEPLGLRYYRSESLHGWVRQVVETKKIDAVIVFSSVMAQFLDRLPPHSLPPVYVDFVDVDSSKWSQYARNRPWPVSWIYAREGRTLLACERRVAAQSEASFFATENEAALFKQLAPECADKVSGMDNGVDADFFAPVAGVASPYSTNNLPNQGKVVAFTGAMDYWPNVDAVCWFVAEMMPLLRLRSPGIRFCIVGRKPSAAVLALAAADVWVTGAVDDVRPYLQHADVVVAPLRVARGIQNKVLEAMAMARPVVASASCLSVIRAVDGVDFVGAVTPEQFAIAVQSLFDSPDRATAMGSSARAAVLRQYSWDAQLSKIDTELNKLAMS